MGADFTDAMRGQFDAGQERFAGDPFATASTAVIVGRVKRRRVITNSAVSGGTLVAIGALVFAAMQAPFAGTSPAASPQGCVTTTPGGDPFPIATVSPDATGTTFAVPLPGDAGAMTLELAPDGSGALLTFPDGSTAAVVPQEGTGYFIFALPDGSPVVAVMDFAGNFKVSIGDATATVVPATTDSVPRVVSAVGPASVTCGGTSDVAVGSPFQCGFPLTGVVHEDDALEIENSGYKSVADANAFNSHSDYEVTNPVATAGEPLVPFVTVVSHEGTGDSLYAGGDPTATRADKALGVTGVSIVKVLDGKVVAVADTSAEMPEDGRVRYAGIVGGDGLSVLIFDDSFFAACPGVTSTAGADLFAVAGSQTWERQQAGEPAIYVWQKLPGAAD